MDINKLHSTLEEGEEIRISKKGNVRIYWRNNENKWVFKNVGNLFENNEIPVFKTRPYASAVQIGFTPYRDFGKLNKERVKKQKQYDSDIVIGIFEMSIENPQEKIICGKYKNRDGEYDTKFVNGMTGFYKNAKLKFVTIEGKRYDNIEKPIQLETEWLDKDLVKI